MFKCDSNIERLNMTAEIIPMTGKAPKMCSFCKKEITVNNPAIIEANDEDGNPLGTVLCKNCATKFNELMKD